MKNLIIILIFILISFQSFSQSGWEVISNCESNVIPFFINVSFRENNTGWILSQNHLKKTTNAGQNWTRLNFANPNTRLKHFAFISANTGWVVDNRYINYTSDGGSNWNIIDSTLHNSSSIFFLDPSSGWMTGPVGMVKRTTNGGQNWSTIPTGITDNLNAVEFINTNTGICAGDWGTILTTTNGGTNWIHFIDQYNGFFSTVEFVDEQTGFVAGSGGRIFRTSNSGINWTTIAISMPHISSIKFNSQNTGFALGSNGIVASTTDLGVNWNLLPGTGILAQIHSADISPSGSIWLTADSGLVYVSTNSGQTWNINIREFITTEDLNSVYFLNVNTGFICGNRGVLLRSTNGGLNWTFVNTNTMMNLLTVKFVNEITGYISGGSGYSLGIILKTTNSGLNWVTSYLDSSHFYSMFFLNETTGWAVGATSNLIKTTNGGLNWLNIGNTPSYSNNSLWFLNENTGFVSGSGINKTTNGGQNWFQSATFSSARLQFTGSMGYATCISNNMFQLARTSNLGTNWILTSIIGGAFSGPLFFVNEETGWVSQVGSIRRTTNGGSNWMQQTGFNNYIHIISMQFVNATSGWAVGYDGLIMRTISGGIGITQISNEIPREFMLKQNYPNPFNPTTKIRFQIPLTNGSDRSLLKIYDALGREIETLVNEHLNPGTYEIEWHAAKYSSGVYFYRISTEKFNETRKMILIK